MLNFTTSNDPPMWKRSSRGTNNEPIFKPLAHLRWNKTETDLTQRCLQSKERQTWHPPVLTTDDIVREIDQCFVLDGLALFKPTRIRSDQAPSDITVPSS